MAFLKIPLPRRGNDKVASAVPRESAEAMRQRAKHRLIGAAVLVLIGIVGFPLVFDTQPRPIAVDVPIVIPDKNSAKPLVMPSQPTQPSGTSTGKTSSAAPAAPATPAAANPPVPPAASLAAKEEVVPDAPAAQAKADQPPAAPKAEPKPQPAQKEAKADAKSAETKPRESKSAEADKPLPSKSAQAKADATARASDAARAEALLDGKGAAAASNVSGRFVVQVGAFADAGKARETRQKLEKAGLKSYTQVVQTKDGPRTRVRVGPFTSRADADRAAGRLKGLEMPASVLSL